MADDRSLCEIWWRDRRARQLVLVGVVLVASGLAHAVVWAVLGGAWEGPVTWRKPILFGISGGLTSLSAAWVWSRLPRRWGERSLAAATAWALFVEVLLIDLQRWRGVASHFNRDTPLDSFLYDAMGVLILFVSAVCVDLTIRLFRSPVNLAPDMLLAARAGMVLLVISCGLGVWVSVYGDLRVAEGLEPERYGRAGVAKFPHGVVIHAIQWLPAIAWAGRTAGLSLAARRRLVAAATAVSALLLAYALAQTLAGRGRFELPGRVATDHVHPRASGMGATKDEPATSAGTVTHPVSAPAGRGGRGGAVRPPAVWQNVVMPLDYDLADTLFRVAPGKKFRLADHDPAWAGDEDVAEKKRKERAAEILEESRAELAATQELLYAADTWSLLVIFQAMDAAGKDGAIKHVMSGVNPQGVEVTSFKHPSAEELDHTFLWRCMKQLPERGRIGIFNRSYYEEVLIVRVHPRLLEAQRIPGIEPGERTWRDRFDDINAFERHLARNGTKVVKFFLNVSRAEQRKRFLDRIDEPDKHWKFSGSDVAERGHWDAYMQAYEHAIRETSTEHAPWYVIPADKKWVSRAAVAAVLAGTIRRLGLEWPQVDAAKKQQIAAARASLEAER